MTTVGRDPERVAAGGVDDRGPGPGPDREVVQVGVVVDQDRGDRLRLVLPVRVFVAITLSPGLSWLIAIAAPEASRTLVDVGEAQTAGCRRVLGEVVCVFWGKDALLRPAGPFEY